VSIGIAVDRHEDARIRRAAIRSEVETETIPHTEEIVDSKDVGNYNT
jgi:hypothetical protein